MVPTRASSPGQALLEDALLNPCIKPNSPSAVRLSRPPSPACCCLDPGGASLQDCFSCSPQILLHPILDMHGHITDTDESTSVYTTQVRVCVLRMLDAHIYKQHTTLRRTYKQHATLRAHIQTTLCTTRARTNNTLSSIILLGDKRAVILVLVV